MIAKKILVIISYSILTAFILVGGSFASSDTLTQKNSTQTETETDNTLPIKDIQRFAMVIAQIKQYYIQPINDKTLFTNAIEGMLSRLDPHSAYLDMSGMTDIEMTTTGKFGGIGIEVMPDDGLIKVVSPLDDTPADRAGIKAGDLIVRVDNNLVRDMSMREAINLMRGKKGSKVTLTIIRKDEKKPLKFDIIRDVIKVQTVKSRILEPGYGYVRISFFQAPAKQDLTAAINQLTQESGGKLKGLILDLRNNPGGLLDAAIEVTDTFLDSRNKNKYNNVIVYTKGRIPGADIKAKASPGDILKSTPLIVLINEGSASASEIVAGALQDHNRAVVLGAKSFGKGSVQTVIPIDYETGIKLTTALYYTPAGRSIQATGIVPDIFVADLKIPKTDTDAVVFDPVAESDLDGHIKNGQPNKSALEKEQVQQEEQALAQTDYQLYEALILLKGLHAITR